MKITKNTLYKNPVLLVVTGKKAASKAGHKGNIWPCIRCSIDKAAYCLSEGNIRTTCRLCRENTFCGVQRGSNWLEVRHIELT